MSHGYLLGTGSRGLDGSNGSKDRDPDLLPNDEQPSSPLPGRRMMGAVLTPAQWRLGRESVAQSVVELSSGD